ncbi:hypothetical protein [Chitinibacter tainanensis]|uniref:hypothetical protein n=1 Tax=Chitinibacter tainanensis TaxID=230667 RepID=UPI00048B43A1|nr:hypothetical protein [Chitinibacter tainanensis]
MNTKIPERLYYNLTQAAAKLQCSEDDLLHFCAIGHLELSVALDLPYLYIQSFENFNPKALKSLCYFPDSTIFFAPIHPLDALNLECTGESKAGIDFECIIEPIHLSKSLKTTYSWEVFGKKTPTEKILFLKQVCPFDWCSDTAEGAVDVTNGVEGDTRFIQDEAECNMHREYIEANEIRLHKGNLFVMADSLNEFMNSSPPKKRRIEHGNTKRFSSVREQILAVALACKHHFPDECKTIAAWQRTIDQKWPLYCADQLEPPLKPSGIENLLSEALKITD